jgi:hypothetical protein
MGDHKVPAIGQAVKHFFFGGRLGVKGRAGREFFFLVVRVSFGVTLISVVNGAFVPRIKGRKNPTVAATLTLFPVM